MPAGAYSPRDEISLFEIPGGVLLMLSRFNRIQRGFTMIEMLTTLVIIGVLMTISVVTFNRARERTLLARVKTNVGQIELRLNDYQSDKSGFFPALTVYHSALPANGSITTDPTPPGDPVQGVPQTLKRMGSALIGGGPRLVDTGNPLQDDFYMDADNFTTSYFRDRQGERPFGEPMTPVDELVKNGHFDSYPENPLRAPGIPMVNVAYILYQYDSETNDSQWVDITVTEAGEVRRGLCAARPSIEGIHEPLPVIWDDLTYPQGDFAYIPFEFTNNQGKYCKGYWIISYGDLNTLQTSEYNKYSLNPDTGLPIDPEYADWPNLPQPYSDGDPTTPPVEGEFQYELKRMMLGALDVRYTIFEDRFQAIEQ